MKEVINIREPVIVSWCSDSPLSALRDVPVVAASGLWGVEANGHSVLHSGYPRCRNTAAITMVCFGACGHAVQGEADRLLEVEQVDLVLPKQN